MRALLLAVLVMAASGVAADAGPRRGKVVRVERRRVAGAAGIHVCIREARRPYVLCVGERPPPRGERISLLGLPGSPVGGTDAHELVEVERSEVAPEDECGSGRLHAVYASPMSSPAVSEPFMIGFRGVKVGPASRLQYAPPVRPSVLTADEQPLLGLDDDGDGSTDMLVTRRECADTAARYGARNADCWNYYRRDAVTWRLVGQDHIVDCGRP